MKKFALLIPIFIFCSNVFFAQNRIIGSKAWLDNHPYRTANPSVQNGNDSLGVIYDTTACGLNYAQASVKLGQRFPSSSVGTVQPATFPISGMPFCTQTAKAYLWCVAAGNGIPVTATVTNPLGNTSNFPMTVVGHGPDMCWGYAGTYTYRADVTSIINGNGNYIISGLPVAPPTTGNDVDGATLMIVYQDLAAGYTGSIHIADGAIVTNGGTSSYNASGFNSCANSTSANAFMIVADLQNLGANLSMNGSAPFTITEDWWNFVSQPTNVLQGQTSCNYSVNASGDCHCLAVAGLYSQTSCSTCNPSTSVLNISTVSITAASCSSNGAATISVTGGSGNYSITWNSNPVQHGLTATNLPAGTYYVSVIDTAAGACSSANIVVPYTGPVLTTSTTGVSCSSLGSASVSVSGGQAPYTYSWAPSGGTSANATNLSAGVYTVSVTDQTGCTINATATVPNNSTLSVSTTSLPDSCPSPTGAVYAMVSGGTPPYSYLWAPGGQTTSSISNLTAGSYTVTVSDNAGCSVSSMVTVNTANVPMSVNVTGNSSINCGGALQLNATPNYSPATYVWSPSTYLNNPNIQNPVATPYGPITYTVTATSQCGTGVDTFAVTINGNNPHNEQICMVSVDTAINKNVITWERNNSPSGGSYNIYRETSTSGVYALIGTQPLSQFTTFTDMGSNPLNMANRYEITTTDTCGVQSTYSIPHRTLFLQVSPALSGGFNLWWTAYEGLIIPTYNIYRGPNASNLTLIGSVAGTIFNYTDGAPPVGTAYYMVEAVNSSWPCVPSRLANPDIASSNGSLSNLQYVTGVGMSESDLLENSLTVIPNPGNGNFELGMQLSHAQEIEINVFDNLGRSVFVQHENAGAGHFSTTMNLETLSSGVYFVQVKTTNGIATKRLIVN
ncbi:MAG TPA: T9SS type A sorting domain-containing protein [Bacteroidia bacterium]|nr:T9SS type A sorting domain-containing protein [Bacteroidia bacterium]